MSLNSFVCLILLVQFAAEPLHVVVDPEAIHAVINSTSGISRNNLSNLMLLVIFAFARVSGFSCVITCTWMGNSMKHLMQLKMEVEVGRNWGGFKGLLMVLINPALMASNLKPCTNGF